MSHVIPFVAVVMVVSWVGYVALTVLTLTEGDIKQFAAWIVLTPFLLIIEWLGLQGLERYSKF